jgi:hypothetical protein
MYICASVFASALTSAVSKKWFPLALWFSFPVSLPQMY